MLSLRYFSLLTQLLFSLKLNQTWYFIFFNASVTSLMKLHIVPSHLPFRHLETWGVLFRVPEEVLSLPSNLFCSLTTWTLSWGWWLSSWDLSSPMSPGFPYSAVGLSVSYISWFPLSQLILSACWRILWYLLETCAWEVLVFTSRNFCTSKNVYTPS